MSQLSSEAYEQTLKHLENVLEVFTNISFGKPYNKANIIKEVEAAYESYCETSDDAYNSSLGSDLHRLSDMIDEHLKKKALDTGIVDMLESEVSQVRSGIEDELANLSWQDTFSEDDSSNDESEVADSSQEQTDEAVHSANQKVLRSPVSPNYEAFVDREAGIAKRMERYTKSEVRFFDASRAIKASTHQLVTTKLQNRQTAGETTKVYLQNHSTRAHIMSDAGAVSRSIEGLDLAQLKTHIDLSKNSKHTVLANAIHWRNSGGSRKWNRHRTFLGKADVGNSQGNLVDACYQDNPCITNLSNFIMSGVGTYGKQILPLLNRLTGEDPDSEKALAQLFIKFTHDAKPITISMLRKLDLLPDNLNMAAQRKIYHQLNKTLFLVVQKEVSRQMHRGIDTESFPFASAIYRALILLKDGHLSLKDVFDADAPYGVFSGKEIMTVSNRDNLLLKFRRVFDLYTRCYNDVDPNHPFLKAHPKALLVETRESNHKLLLAVAGGASDSEGDQYETSDEETPKFK